METGYYKTKESVKEYITLAKDVNGQELIHQLQVVLPAESAVLEIGSGPGSDWEILNELYQVVGSDNSTEFLDHLTATFSDGEFLELDATTLATDKSFNGVYSNKVLHHLKDSELSESVKRQHEIVLPDGIICHSFWKGEGSEVFKGLFVNYHNEASIRAAFGEYFEVLTLVEYAEFDEGDSLLLIAKKK